MFFMNTLLTNNRINTNWHSLSSRWDTLHDIVATWPRYFLHLFFTEADDSSRFSVNEADSSHIEAFILEVEVSWKHSWWNSRLDFKTDTSRNKIFMMVVVDNMEPRLQKLCSNATKVTPAGGFWRQSVPGVQVVCELRPSKKKLKIHPLATLLHSVKLVSWKWMCEAPRFVLLMLHERWRGWSSFEFLLTYGSRSETKQFDIFTTW